MNYAIILAAGKGSRAGDSPKQFIVLGGKPLFKHSADIFENHPQIDQVIIVGPGFVEGGETRQESAQKGVEYLNPSPNDLLIFHNAANPFVTPEEISQVIEAAQQFGAACVARPVVCTLKSASNQIIKETISRENIYEAETPQVIRAELYLKALNQNIKATDEMMLVESIGVHPKIISASVNNFKITTARDLEFAKFILEGGETRSGIGQDSHCFHDTEKGLTLGGLYLSNEPKAIANSDGDVIIHALCNALLQALGEGSFSRIADPLCQQGIKDSREYLHVVLNKLEDFQIIHVGLQIEGSIPKIDPIEKELRLSLSNLLQIQESQIGITSTTGEKLTSFGQGKGLQCFAVVTLKSISKNKF